MTQISAAAVMKLRKMSGQGMMDCKKALEETKGNLEEALTLLRKKGMVTMEKRAARDTSEGRIVAKTKDNATVLVALCCETDFVAKNDDFIATAEILADYALACKCGDGQKLADTELNGKKFSDLITELVSKTGEKTEIGEYTKYFAAENSCIGTYIHFNNKIAAIVDIEADSAAVANSDELKEFATGVCMHIAATKPLALNKDSFDPEVIAKEEEIAKEQVKDKPANIIEKIVEGKINRFLADNCLINQKYVKNEELTVEEALNQAAKAAGGKATIKKFTRIEIA